MAEVANKHQAVQLPLFGISSPRLCYNHTGLPARTTKLFMVCSYFSKVCPLDGRGVTSPCCCPTSGSAVVAQWL